MTQTSRSKKDIDYKDKCKCDKPSPVMYNYEMMWHEGDICCGQCDKFIRYYDAG